MSPEQFVSDWLNSPNENWRNNYYALENRYSHGALKRELVDEQEWAFEVYQTLTRYADEAKGFRSPRIRRVIPKILLELANERRVAAAK